MLKKILKGYISLISSLSHILLLAGICLGCGVLISWPLWKLATVHPDLYTLVFAGGLSLIVLFISVNRFRIAYSRDPRAFLLSLARKATILAGIATSCMLVLSWQRIAALGVVILTVLVYGFLAFGLSSGKNSRSV